MQCEDRRDSKRVELRLPVSWASVGSDSRARGDLWTRNVSAGGMYVHASSADAPAQGEVVHFQMTVPPGVGYSTSSGKVIGNGKVVRANRLETGDVGVAICFTRSLAIDFPTAQ